jgi:multicomponent Na+:H+ antiporter subunit E
MSIVLLPFRIVVLFLQFFWDLVKSSVQVARAVLTPGDSVSPGFVTVPMPEGRSDLEITLIANYITLTPGTLTVDVSPDRRMLLIHSLLSGADGDGVRADVRDSIDPRVLRATRP